MITKERVEKMGLAVVYGDTDSIMINTNTKDAPAAELIGRKVSCVEDFLKEMFQLQSSLVIFQVVTEINKNHRLLEIEIDYRFKSFLLLAKKKYAGICIEPIGQGAYKEEPIRKGLDIVRRDWSGVAKEAGE